AMDDFCVNRFHSVNQGVEKSNEVCVSKDFFWITGLLNQACNRSAVGIIHEDIRRKVFVFFAIMEKTVCDYVWVANLRCHRSIVSERVYIFFICETRGQSFYC